MTYLLDTNVVSELRRIRSGKADPNVKRWAEQADVLSQYISVITLHELERGICMIERRDRAQGRLLRTWLIRKVLPAFEGRTLPIDTAVAMRSAALHVPDPRPERDTFIAATALEHRLTLVTRNISDFALPGIKLVNPWQTSEPA